MKYLGYLLLISFLIVLEISRVYFIMPFPGSQQDDVIELAYFLHQYIFLLRIVGLILLIWPSYQILKSNVSWVKWTAVSLFIFWLMVFYAFNFRFLADKMFYQPEQVVMLEQSKNKVPLSKLVLGVEMEGRAKAYPIEIIGYHHQVRDTLAGQELMITYCTVCRTGRVYDPQVNGKPEQFRLVGMDHFNAMFEDHTTGSWWRQVSGEAIVGPLKGQVLAEIPSQQMSLQSWLAEHPNSYVLQPDPKFQEQYDSLAGYDDGSIKGSLEGTDSLSWKDKSWVVGISMGLFSKAYDWNDLKASRIVNDEVGGSLVLITLEEGDMSHHSFNRILEGDTLNFQYDQQSKKMIDNQTQSIWEVTGTCIDGKWKGSKLKPVQSYQEFWHSWKTFHPNTTQYGK